MPIAKLARDARSAAVTRATWGGSQNFLGARWVERVVETAPIQIRKRVALRFLSLSPHYFYACDLRAEAERNRQSRLELVDAFVAPYLSRTARILDYGCGPGYMACAVAGRVEHVDAVDVSRGVLACAKTLNQRPNISYLTPADFEQRAGQVDLAYSFAVVQHLTSDVLVDVLNLLANKLRQNGILLLHFPLPDQDGWRTEAECVASQSVADRAKLRFGLNCFGRSAAEMEELVSDSGFTDVAIHPLSGCVDMPCDDDITKQHVLTARRQRNRC